MLDTERYCSVCGSVKPSCTVFVDGVYVEPSTGVLRRENRVVVFSVPLASLVAKLLMSPEGLHTSEVADILWPKGAERPADVPSSISIRLNQVSHRLAALGLTVTKAEKSVRKIVVGEFPEFSEVSA